MWIHGIEYTIRAGADLRWTDLSEADLREADLRRADLRRTALNWDSHDLIAEILRSAAGESVPRRMLAGLILVSRDWCWDEFLRIDHPDRQWAADVLRTYATDRSPLPDAAADL